MIEITNRIINQAGWSLLIIGSLYLLFAYGQAIRKVRPSAAVRRMLVIVTEDIRLTIAGFAMVLSGTIAWTLGLGNLGAAVGGLAVPLTPAWTFFTSFILGVTEALRITEFNIVSVVALSVAAGVAAFVLREIGFFQWRESEGDDEMGAAATFVGIFGLVVVLGFVAMSSRVHVPLPNVPEIGLTGIAISGLIVAFFTTVIME